MIDQDVNENRGQRSFLATKLFIPRSSSRLVLRPSLIAKLNLFHHHKMTLVSAPAGFGKTTVLTQWVAQLDGPVAWVSLDEKDNDLFTFFHYLIAALQKIDSSLGVNAAHALQTATRKSLTSVIIPLLNDISAYQNQLCIILDDYHCIQSQEVHGMLKYILDHLPPQLHLILSTRADPPLPLAKMRARNNLAELRINELCFKKDDIDAFFREIMGMSLSEENISTLEYRTEGWAAGLQLAAISLQSCENAQNFIEAFAGDNRYIVDYLVEEVLNKQTKQIHDFLLQTSLLTHMSAELCNYVLEMSESQTIMEDLEQQNLFIVPLDNTRNWFRYHHLFADLLYQKLMQSEPNLISHLRIRASEWHERNGNLDSAIEYAIGAEAYERAAKLLEQVSENDWEHGKRTKLYRWFQKLPSQYIQNIPELCLLYAWVLLDDNKQKEAERSLAAVDRFLQQQESGGRADADQQRGYLDEIRGKVGVLRALCETGRGDIPRMIDNSDEALQLLPDDSLTWKANCYFTHGIAYSIKGELNAAVDSFLYSMKLSKADGNLDLYFRASYWLVARLTYAGQLDRACRICDDLFEVVRENRLERSLIGAGVFVSWGNILYERNRLDEAYENISKDLDIIEASHDIGHKAWCYFCTMKTLAALNNVQGAEQIIEKLARLKKTSELPYSFYYLTESGKAQVWLKQGKLEKVGRWLQENNFSITDEVTAYRDLGQIIFARFLIAQGEIDDAKFLLEKLILGQEELGRSLLLIESLLIQAQIFEKESDMEGAVRAITRALRIAEKGNCIRVFINEGKSVARLIDNLLNDNFDIPKSFAKKLLAEFTIIESHEAEKPESALLSERELEILRFIAAGLSNKTITEKLFISLSTVKTHLRNIYSKLDAHSRTEAVAKANDLDLL